MVTVGGIQVTREVLTEARAWAADCEGRSGLMPVQVTIMYVARYYPGGWAAFDAECGELVSV